MAKKVYRFPNAGWFGGVCAGIAYRLKIQAWIVRLVWCLLFLLYGLSFWAYSLGWIFIPKADTPDDYKEICE